MSPGRLRQQDFYHIGHELCHVVKVFFVSRSIRRSDSLCEAVDTQADCFEKNLTMRAAPDTSAEKEEERKEGNDDYTDGNYYVCCFFEGDRFYFWRGTAGPRLAFQRSRVPDLHCAGRVRDRLCL